MPEIPTVAIHSPKDDSQMWIINRDDYDPEKHQLWGEAEPAIGIDSDGNEFTQSDLDKSVIRQVGEGQYVMETPEPEHAEHRMVPSVPDFIEDEQGNILSVNIIDPDRRNARKELPFESYDPDHHELWSSHPRFNK